jgi:acyl carrier protein
MPQSSLEHDVARMIVETLQLEMKPDEIDPDAALFKTGLGLDSIDALELALAMSREYGVEIRADDGQNDQIFASLRSLSNFINANRK